MDSCKPKTEDETQNAMPTVQISFHLSVEEDSSQVMLPEMRETLRENAEAITRVDKSLVTLKNSLLTMRDQDLQLLKQLIQIGDTIRRLSRSHDRRSGSKRNSSRSTQELMTTAVDLSVTLRRFKDHRRSSIFSSGAGEYNTVPLVRRQSEPQMCTLSPRGDLEVTEVRSWGSRRGSGSSTDWWSEDTMGSSEDGLGTLDTDDGGSKGHGISDITTNATTISPNTSATSITSESTSACGLTDDTEGDSFDTESEKFVQRPKSHSVVAATFLNRPKLSGGNSSYSDILNKNVRLWKDRLEHAQNVRQKISILEEESHEV